MTTLEKHDDGWKPTAYDVSWLRNVVTVTREGATWRTTPGDIYIIRKSEKRLDHVRGPLWPYHLRTCQTAREMGWTVRDCEDDYTDEQVIKLVEEASKGQVLTLPDGSQEAFAAQNFSDHN